MDNHSSSRITGLYDHRRDDISLDESRARGHLMRLDRQVQVDVQLSRFKLSREGETPRTATVEWHEENASVV